MDVVALCNRIIKVGFFLLFALIPLLLTPWNYELFEYNKMMAVYAITITISAAWLVKMIKEREIRIAKTPLDIPILLFLSSQLLSTMFSMDPHVSWFGYYSRFNGSMWSVISYAVLYFAFVSNIQKKLMFINASLSTATIIAIYGVAERLGIDKHLWVQDVQNRVFSTLGQPNWLAAYLVALLPLAMEKNIFLSVLFFIVLLFTRSRSGLLGFAASDMLYWGLLRFRQPFAKLHVAFVILFLLFGAAIVRAADYTAPLLESGGTESGTIRKYVWQGALASWKSSPKTMLIGTGTETFAFAFYQYRPIGHNLTSEWDFLYNKAHNEYLNYLATTGILGLAAHMYFLWSCTLWFLKNKNTNGAIFAGWASLLVTNFFGFSTVVTQLFLFLFPAMIVTAGRRTRVLKLPMWSVWIPVAIGIYVLIKIGLFWYADTLFAAGYRANRAGTYGQAQTLLARSMKLNPGEPFYHDELGTVLGGLAVAAIEQGDATGAATLAQRAISESDQAIGISPQNVNFWKSRTKIFYALSAFDPQFNTAAIKTLEKALALSPSDPKILYNIAILYGREGNNAKAIEELKEAIRLKPNYRDAFWALSIFYTETREPDLARSILEDYLTTADPNDKEFQEKVRQ